MALLEVKNLHTYFKTKKGTVKAVNDVSYSLEPGRTIGIVGESGSGKSVSAMSILRLLDDNGYIASGSIRFDGTPEEVFSNPKELSDIGLSVPAPTQIAAALREQGARIEGSIYTIEQLLAALLKLKKEAGRNA